MQHPRFSHLDAATAHRMVEMLKEKCQATMGKRLSSSQFDELLGMLPPNYFRALENMGINETSRKVRPLEAAIKDPATAGEALAAAYLENELDEQDMNSLRLNHPEAWYFAYKKIASSSPSAARKLSPRQTRGFSVPQSFL